MSLAMAGTTGLAMLQAGVSVRLGTTERQRHRLPWATRRANSFDHNRRGAVGTSVERFGPFQIPCRPAVHAHADTIKRVHTNVKGNTATSEYELLGTLMSLVLSELHRV